MTRGLVGILGLLAILIPSVKGQEIPSPQQYFGFEMGSDRKLANWDELTEYYEELAQRSHRVIVDTLGMTTTGRPFVMLTITSPENHARLGELREIQMKLADPRIISGELELNQLFEDGKAVAMITHGIHSSEVGPSQMAARLAYTMASSNEERVLEILVCLF